MILMILIVLTGTLFPQIIAKHQTEPVAFRNNQRDEMIRLIRRWYPPTEEGKEHYDPDSMREAQSKLLSIAGRSDRSRKEVIDTIIECLQQVRVERFYVYRLAWYFSSDTLGLLKATEAIDFLAECLNLSDDLESLSVGINPVGVGLVKIGNAAIPKVSLVLAGSSSRTARLHAAMALADIGGEDAKRALRDALQTETDQHIISYIGSVLGKR